ncbi:MAG TPA: MEDS domain-containing protein [Ramlibacter sp.]|nr:MEDS domain-containing protein [Ramlibacter sp.]
MEIVSGHEHGIDVFWGEIAPCEHLVQIYDEESVFLDALEGFVAGGLDQGDGIVVIATPVHVRALESRLRARRVDVDAARAQDQYIALDAAQTLSKFMVDGWPDDDRFKALVTQLLSRAGAEGRRVRAFGEMVAVLWQQQHHGATVRLEHLWHRFCREEAFSLLCAYPKSGFTRDATASIQEICDAHSRVIPG